MIARNIVAAVFLTCVLASQGLAQSAATTDPWKRVPAPTSCFVDDGYEAKLHQAREEIAADMEKQEALNATLKEKFDAMDMREKMSRIQAYMMKDPQAAMKMMQAQQADAASMTSGITSAAADEGALRKELETHTANFNSAADALARPFQAQRSEWIKAKAKSTMEGASFVFVSQADLDKYLALFAEENATYEKMCGPFFGANGTFPAWLSAYRTKVTEKMIDAGVKQDATIATQMAIMDTPTGGYRSTAPLKGVRDYLHEVIQVYALRRHKAGDPRFEKGTKK
jgi:uncharacterized membrane protein